MLISFWVKNRRSFLNALRWKGILFSKSPSNSIFNCLCYHTPHSFPQSFSWFQSTLPRGERRDVVSSWKWRLYFNPRSHEGNDSNFTQNSISVLFHFYQSFPYIIFPHTALFRLLIIFCTFFLVRIAQGFPVCFHFAPKQYPAFYNVCSTDLL